MSEDFPTPYAGYNVLDKWDSPSWNEQTRQVVWKRIGEAPTRRFLDEDEWATMEAVCARVIPQPDRPESPVPIVPFIDEQLHRGHGDGYRYEDMPNLRTAWRAGIAGINREAHRRFDMAFRNLNAELQDAVLRAIQKGDVSGDPWTKLPPQRFFLDLLKAIVGIYYAHPAAWSEIGFGGPASPRGYVRLGSGQRDPWEAREKVSSAKADNE